MDNKQEQKKDLLKVVRGIDISKWQGHIDWEYVRPEFEFVIIKLCRINGGMAVMDNYCLENIQAALDRGYKVGIYIYVEKYGYEGLYKAGELIKRVYSQFGAKAFKMGTWLDPEYEALNNVDANVRIFKDRTETALEYLQQVVDEVISPIYKVGLYYNYDFYQHVYEKKIFYLPQHYHWRVGFATTRRVGDLYQNTSSERLYVKEWPINTRVDVDEITMTIPMYNKFKYGKAGGPIKHGEEQ